MKKKYSNNIWILLNVFRIYFLRSIRKHILNTLIINYTYILYSEYKIKVIITRLATAGMFYRLIILFSYIINLRYTLLQCRGRVASCASSTKWKTRFDSFDLVDYYYNIGRPGAGAATSIWNAHRGKILKMPDHNRYGIYFV